MHKKRPRRGGPLGPHADRRGGKPKGLAARIVKRRLALGLSQEKAAGRIGVSVRALAGWELGVTPSPLYRKALEDWLR